MGMFKRKHTAFYNGITIPVDPNPSNFVIKETYKGKHYYACKVYYPDCTNYEGMKYIVCKHDPRLYDTLDPHFTENGSIVARFEPTDFGWIFAKQMADSYLHFK